MLWIPACRSKGKVKIELVDNLKSWLFSFEFPGNLKVQGIYVINIQ
jgi:hypothetical protein